MRRNPEVPSRDANEMLMKCQRAQHEQAKYSSSANQSNCGFRFILHFDTDGSGKLTVPEFKRALEVLLISVMTYSLV